MKKKSKKKPNNGNKLLIFIFSLTLLLTIIGTTSLYFLIKSKGEKNVTVVTNEILTIIYESGQKIEIINVEPGFNSQKYIIRIKNITAKSISYDFIWTDVINQFKNKNLLFNLSREGQIIYENKVAPRAETNLLENIQIKGGVEQTYELTFHYPSDAQENTNAFKSIIEVVNSKD